MTTSATEPATPAEPGRGPAQSLRGRAGLVVVGLVAALAAGGFGIIAAYAGQTPGIVAQTVTYKIADTSVELDYSVAKSKDDEVRCTVDAFDEKFTVLAAQEVSVPAGKSSVKGTATLRTPRRATGARIHGCRAV
ncbi:DUF4307 domain-containing protein [Actinomadura sp. 9N215]|uniref:DUF4307 domain-containing protein n=1 Tax=Actinomadura sp. 9N215 TaxID=3375150 RepID=UPI0037A84B80